MLMGNPNSTQTKHNWAKQQQIQNLDSPLSACRNSFITYLQIRVLVEVSKDAPPYLSSRAPRQKGETRKQPLCLLCFLAPCSQSQSSASVGHLRSDFSLTSCKWAVVTCARWPEPSDSQLQQIKQNWVRHVPPPPLLWRRFSCTKELLRAFLVRSFCQPERLVSAPSRPPLVDAGS